MILILVLVFVAGTSFITRASSTSVSRAEGIRPPEKVIKVTPSPVTTTTVAPTTTTTVPPTTIPPPPPPTTTVPPPPPEMSYPTYTPDQMGAAALQLVRYPWQSIPGYTILFEPIADAPAAGYYGNTSFTWGQPGGQSIMYVYPGETVSHLATITAFEIGHEVDAAGVYPAGGHQALEDLIGVHPGSWAPNCDCDEHNYLSGWYAAAFSNYWGPVGGAGQWSAIATEPGGATLTAMQPWLNPKIG